MKLIIAFIALVCSTAASAESQTETTYLDGKWRVQVAHDTETGNLNCDLRGDSEEGFFLVTVASDDFYKIFFYFEGRIANEQSQNADVTVMIDHYRWNLSDGRLVDADYGAFYVLSLGHGHEKQTKNFMADFVHGHRMTMIDENNDPYFTVYLGGSVQAMRALEECRVSISSTY
jgi:hypothetical protein